MADRLITPDELRCITEQKEVEKMREALEKKRRMDEERHHFHDTSTHQDIHPDDRDAQGRFSALVRGAAERGEREVLALRLPSEYCTGGGRAINHFEPDWPHTLTGFARRAYEFWQRELEARGNKLPAQIMDFPGGNAGRCRGFSQVVSCFR